jgi:hypothetical protein
VQLHESGKSEETPVTLEELVYKARLEVNGPSGNRAVDRQLLAYELHSTDDAKPFEWWYYSSWPSDFFGVVSDNRGATYLAWSEHLWAVVADISQPRSQDMALNEHLRAVEKLLTVAQRGTVQVPVIRLVGTAPFSGLNAVCFEAHVVSIKRDDAGESEVQVHGVDPKQVFTFLSHGDKWSLKGSPPTPAAK